VVRGHGELSDGSAVHIRMQLRCGEGPQDHAVDELMQLVPFDAEGVDVKMLPERLRKVCGNQLCEEGLDLCVDQLAQLCVGVGAPILLQLLHRVQPRARGSCCCPTTSCVETASCATRRRRGRRLCCSTECQRRARTRMSRALPYI
jgi:hypothetical protein